VSRAHGKPGSTPKLKDVADYFLVEHVRGPAWDPRRARREQAGWDAHAAFMDKLAEEGVILLGGPVGDVDGQMAVLVCRTKSEVEIRNRLALDPWADNVLAIGSVQPWTIWLRANATL
jgi:uncharacterized protein YciI